MRKIFLAPTILENKNKELRYLYDPLWCSYFKNYSLNFINPSNLDTNSIKKKSLIILPGGNDPALFSNKKIDKIRYNFDVKLIKFSIENKISLLAICSGFQNLALFFKGSINLVKNHIGTKHKVFIHKKNKIEIAKVNSYHKYGIKNIRATFEYLGYDHDGFIEIAAFKKHKILATMFHPERKNQSHKIIKSIILNFIK